MPKAGMVRRYPVQKYADNEWCEFRSKKKKKYTDGREKKHVLRSGHYTTAPVARLRWSSARRRRWLHVAVVGHTAFYIYIVIRTSFKYFFALPLSVYRGPSVRIVVFAPCAPTKIHHTKIKTVYLQYIILCFIFFNRNIHFSYETNIYIIVICVSSVDLFFCSRFRPCTRQQ